MRPSPGLSTLLDIQEHLDVPLARLALRLDDGEAAQTLRVDLIPGPGAARFTRGRTV